MERLILTLEIANDVYKIIQSVSYQEEKQSTALVPYQPIDLDQIDFEEYFQEQEKMNFLKRVGNFIKEIFSEDYDTEGLITPFGVVSI